MVKIIGIDKKKKKRVTCGNCASILEYTPSEIFWHKYTVMGDDSGFEAIQCPSCEKLVRVGRSY
jgi:ribosomal protein S27E